MSAPAADPCWAPGYAHVSARVPGASFEFRAVPDDFVVEEIPSFEPTGEGTHVVFEVEKRGLATVTAVRRLAAALGRREAEVGFAGRKDARAVARQRMSVEHVEPARLQGLEISGLCVLSVARHPRKLRLGQLAGNRFRLRLRGVSREDERRIQAVLELLERGGMPNWIGAQRFGRRGQTWRLGHLLLARRYEEYLLELVSPRHATDTPERAELERVLREGTTSERRRLGALAPRLEPDLARLARQVARRPRDAERAVASLTKRTRQFHLSALQSRVFNRVLGLRLASPLSIARLAVGDLAWVHDSGASFRVEDPAAEQARLERLEISPSGPIPGWRSALAEGPAGEMERAALAAEGIETEAFRAVRGGLDPRGVRRALRVPLGELSLERDGDDCVLGFRLPKGSFATTLVEELRKDFGRASPLSPACPPSDR